MGVDDDESEICISERQKAIEIDSAGLHACSFKHVGIVSFERTKSECTSYSPG
jgi:hypothetical protein